MFEIVDDYIRRDPALKHRYQVIFFHTGYRALRAYRQSHYLWQHGHLFLAQLLANRSKRRTGIDIHPGATIGQHLVIDHGVNVVIGEETVIGNDVTIYQGVTLGARCAVKDGIRRHPTIGDRVLIGAGAKIIGNIHVGPDSKVGANAVVLQDILAGQTVVGIPARVVS
ncbi:serine acetyltransferase [Fructobacillus pseudoficulneus]|uniref:Serine acetyltransferase n=1 Tax=Fructobacillus pseudoficulneus TaxID=220714 RepID=A0A3F3H1R8_9LACO|nr:serine O-acetyltransferase EpsC [Fructobacillus pseudoficulneus]GAP02130.1 serine acetyltransferase [Fructobacillus pseudoficulneus]SEH35822.1 serine O-acetyltransferase [Fructobacillus pseudoficulneus]